MQYMHCVRLFSLLYLVFSLPICAIYKRSTAATIIIFCIFGTITTFSCAWEFRWITRANTHTDHTETHPWMMLPAVECCVLNFSRTPSLLHWRHKHSIDRFSSNAIHHCNFAFRMFHECFACIASCDVSFLFLFFFFFVFVIEQIESTYTWHFSRHWIPMTSLNRKKYEKNCFLSHPSKQRQKHWQNVATEAKFKLGQ